MKMADAIMQAVALLRSQMDEFALYRELVQRGVERPTATRLVAFLPMVYCRLILVESGLRFPETYQRTLPDGTHSPSIPLSSESVWNEAMTFAESERRNGVKGQALMAIAERSAEFQAANKLVNGGSELKDVRFTETLLTWPESGPDL